MKKKDNAQKTVRETLASPAMQEALKNMDRLEIEFSADEVEARVKNIDAKLTIHLRDGATTH